MPAILLLPPLFIFKPSYGPATNKPTTEWGHYEYLSILRGLHIDDNYIALYT